MKRALITMIIMLMIFTVIHPIKSYAATEDEIVAQMNVARINAGLGTVALDSQLTAAAQTRAIECAEYFSHTRPDGQAWSTISCLTNGENLARARNENQSRPENVVMAWILSPSHKRNVMRQTCTSVGVGYYKADNGITYIVCEFN